MVKQLAEKALKQCDSGELTAEGGFGLDHGGEHLPVRLPEMAGVRYREPAACVWREMRARHGGRADREARVLARRQQLLDSWK